MFQAKVTRLHSPRTASSPRSRNWRNPSTDLMMPNTGPGVCWRSAQAKISRARDQLLTFLDHPGRVEVTNNACERALRPAVIQRKVTNGYRAMWAAEGEAPVRTVVDTARLTSGTTVFSTILTTISA